MDIVALILLGIPLAVAFRRLKALKQSYDLRVALEQITRQRLEQIEARLARLEGTEPQSASATISEAAPAPTPQAPESRTVAPASFEQSHEPIQRPPVYAAPQARASARTGSLGTEAAPIGSDALARLQDWLRNVARGFIREQIGGQEWEAIVGGNLLNKLGVLVLLIGLALFLGFSLTRMGPLGRIAVGLVVSLAMLTGGVFMERRSRYVVFGRGLIGGGWAGLYTTTFAAYGLQSARVIESPALATILLLAVAAGMIVHSIRYHSEAVTGLAYLVGFVTLAISPMSSFALVASAPLVASLLYVVNRFQWERMTIAAIVVTYASYAWGSRDSAGAPAVFATGQAALAIYWLMYEAFDLAALSRQRRRVGAGRALATLNACGFLGVATLQWIQYRHDDLFILFAYSAAAFLLSAIARYMIASVDETMPLQERAAAGGFEGSITVSAALAAAAVFQRYAGYSVNVALLLEAQFLFLVGVQVGQPYLQVLGAIVFAIAAGKWAVVDVWDDVTIQFRGLKFSGSTPIGILMAAAGYLDRAMSMRWRTRGRWRTLAWSASIILGVVIGMEADAAHTGLWWLALAGGLFEAGWFADDLDFRLQSYVASMFGLIAVGTVNLDVVPTSNPHPSVSLLLGVLFAYGASAQLMYFARESLSERERAFARDGASLGGSALAMILLWHLMPALWVACAWMALAVLLVEAGFALTPRALRLEGYAVAAIACMRLFDINFDAAGHALFISDRVLTVAPVIAALYYLSWLVNSEIARRSLDRSEAVAAGIFLYGAAPLVMLLIWYEAARETTVIGWALFGLALLLAGVHGKTRDLRLQSYMIAFAVFARCWVVNFDLGGQLLEISQRVVTGGISIACLYASQFLSPAADTEHSPRAGFDLWLGYVEDNARAGFSILATAMLTLLFFYQVSGNLLTVAWAFEAVALMSAGFAMRERVLRLSGLVIFAAAIVKVFAYDFRQLDAMPRILSFIVLGAMLIAVSFAYSRYREKLSRFL